MSNLIGSGKHKKSLKLIEFNPNGGTCSETSRIMQVGLKFGTLPEVIRDVVYTFTGWYTELDGGDLITPQSEVLSDVTLYAHWNTASFTISFNANGHGTNPSSIEVEYGTQMTNLPTFSDPAGHYNFKGWYYNGTLITSETVYTYTTNITLTASWEAKQYTVTFNGNGHGTPSFSTKTVSYGSTYGTLPTISDSSGQYTFKNWTVNNTAISATTTVSISSDVIVYASWEAKIAITLNPMYGHFSGMAKGVTKTFYVDKGALLDSVLSTPCYIDNPPSDLEYHVWAWSKVEPIIDDNTGNPGNITNFSKSGGIIMYKGYSTATQDMTLYPIFEAKLTLTIQASGASQLSAQNNKDPYNPNGNSWYTDPPVVTGGGETITFNVTNWNSFKIWLNGKSGATTRTWRYVNLEGKTISLGSANGIYVPVPYAVLSISNTSSAQLYISSVARLYVELTYSSTNTKNWIRSACSYPRLAQ